jgi:glyoxylase-like metal-dependent hydrolase (beta-lactamase superfamily II)
VFKAEDFTLLCIGLIKGLDYMELKSISDSVLYIPNASNIGIIKNGNDCILIDTGLDSGTGKQILPLLSQKGLQVKAIINTHAHADHYGGNRIIKEKTNCLVCAPAIEAAIIENPILEPTSFFSGANPPTDLKNKFLMAEPCKVDKIIEEGSLELEGLSLKIVALKGHSINQIGVAFEDMLFCADSFFSKETIEKHKIPFFTNIKETKKTLNTLKESTYKTYVPSHLQPTSNPAASINENLRALEKIESNLFELIVEENSIEQLLKGLCLKMEIKIGSMQQYCLLKTSLLAFLEYLHANRKVDYVVENNQLHWIRN